MAERGAKRIGDETVRERTGKTWAQWFADLDRAGARRMTHKERAVFLHDERKVAPWWSQTVAVAYEQERGLRAKHEKPEGFEVSVSRTLPASAARLFDAWKDPTERAGWLTKRDLAIRKATPGKVIRATWFDGKSAIEVRFTVKGASKGQVTVQHGRLRDAEAAARMKAYWADRLERLRKLVETPARKAPLKPS